MIRGRSAATGLLVASDAAVLLRARPEFGRLLAGLGAPHVWFARDGVDGALAALALGALWLAAAWLAVGLLAAAAARLPGLAGAAAGALARLLLPRVVRSVLAGSAGLGVLLAPVAAGAAGTGPAAAGPTARPAVAARTATLPSPTWPLAAGHSPAVDVPPPGWPVDHPAHEPADRVPVHPGDSLWVIAARRLGPRARAADVAAAWPRWYAANRAVIGADPDRLVPGEVLHAPPATAREESRS